MSNITNLTVRKYIESLYRPASPFLENLRTIGEGRNIPIMTRDAEMMLDTLIRIAAPRSILEIGTAIGYSAIFFATVSKAASITTIEISGKMYEEAMLNIRDSGLSQRIDAVQGDALDVLTEIGGNYDMIFIDASKGHYREFFDLCLKKSVPGTIIVSDNILFRGITASDEFLDKRRNKTIMRRMRDYLEYITHHEGVSTSVLPIGDGIAVSVIGQKETIS